MIKFKVLNPSETIVLGDLAEYLKKNPIKDTNTSLEYRLKQIKEQIAKATYNGNTWFVNKLLKEAEEIKTKMVRPISWEKDGNVYIRTGFIPYLEENVKLLVEKEDGIEYEYTMPKPRPYPFKNNLKFQPYEYQRKAVELLLQRRHATVESATGTGKTLMIVMLAQKLGLKTLIVTPFVSIFNQIVKEFEYYFGEKSVGVYGGGRKKNLNANFVIAVSDSIANLQEGDKDWDLFKDFQVSIFDEAHTLSAETLEYMAFGPLKNIPYRYFLTGTHTRPDGLNNLLNAITGPVVMSYKTKQAIEDGYITPFKIKILDVDKSPVFLQNEKDPMAVKRHHFLYNPNISSLIADISIGNLFKKNESGDFIEAKKGILILVSEVKQIYYVYEKIDNLLRALNINKTAKDIVAIASATTSKDQAIKSILPPNKSFLGKKKNLTSLVKELGIFEESVWDFIDYLSNSDINTSIEDFNMGKKRILIGTSAISTGVNLFPTHITINWQGGSSEIVCKQGAIGRSVRKLELSPYKEYHEPKPFSLIIDFNVRGVPILYSMLKKRMSYYEE